MDLEDLKDIPAKWVRKGHGDPEVVEELKVVADPVEISGHLVTMGQADPSGVPGRKVAEEVQGFLEHLAPLAHLDSLGHRDLRGERGHMV